MEPVITVNLGGTAYQLETSAHAALSAYLKSAEAALADNPDKAEILKDLELAVADKASAYLSAYKNVISNAEMAQILAEMGPVEGAQPQSDTNDAPQADAHAASSGPRAAKTLYRVRDQSSVTGVSAGLAAYFDLDVNLIRLLWIFATLFSGGFFFLPYIFLMFWMPLASTPEQIAAAHGAPFNAQEVIARAQSNFEEFAAQGRSSWRAWRRELRHTRREARRAEARAMAQNTPPPPAGPFGFLARIFGGLFLLLFSLIGVVLLISFLLTLFSLVTTHSIFGWPLPNGVPFWAAIIVLAIVYGALAGPIGSLQGAAKNAATGTVHHHHHGGGFFALLVLAVVGWVAYHNVPEARLWMETAFTQFQVWVAGLNFPS